MKRMVSSALMVAVALSVGVRAQSASGMAQDGKMDKMDKMGGKTVSAFSVKSLKMVSASCS